MSEAPSILVISNIAWDFVWQRHQTIAALFAGAGYDVWFCEIPGTRSVGLADFGRVVARFRSLQKKTVPRLPPRVKLLRPFVLPATNSIFCTFNALQIRRMVKRQPILSKGVDYVLNYSASRTALCLIENVRHRRLVYDCTDDWLAVRGIPAFLPDDERELLRQADLTLVPSRRLLERKSADARCCVHLPHGALVQRFLMEPRNETPGEPASGPFTILYYGHLHRQHLDFELLDGLAWARPRWRILLVGPIKTSHTFPANVELPGQQPHEALRDFAKQADVLLLPYVINEYTKAVLPAKIYECLATGRPVVSAKLPELMHSFSDHLHFAEGVGGWLEAIERAVASDSRDAREKRIALARMNSWEARFDQILSLLKGLDAQ